MNTIYVKPYKFLYFLLLTLYILRINNGAEVEGYVLKSM